MLISKSHKSLLDSKPQEVYLAFDFEFAPLIQLSTFPEFNLDSRNYEWIIGLAFEYLRNDSDQEYQQADFAVRVISTLMPQIKLLECSSENEMISRTLIDLVKNLRTRLINERLFVDNQFPYIPVKFIGKNDVLFEYVSDPLPFSFNKHI